MKLDRSKTGILTGKLTDANARWMLNQIAHCTPSQHQSVVVHFSCTTHEAGAYAESSAGNLLCMGSSQRPRPCMIIAGGLEPEEEDEAQEEYDVDGVGPQRSDGEDAGSDREWLQEEKSEVSSWPQQGEGRLAINRNARAWLNSTDWAAAPNAGTPCEAPFVRSSPCVVSMLGTGLLRYHSRPENPPG